MPKQYKNQWPRRNLSEIIRFLESVNPQKMTLKIISEKIGTTEQNLSNIFIKDDMKLSRAMKIAEVYGYELTLLFPKWKDYGIPPLHKKNEYPNAGQLKGLIEYTYNANCTIHKIAKMTGIDDNCIRQAFQTGDIRLSFLYRIMAELNIDAKWNFTKKENPVDNSGCLPENN